jgi:hypothetical protein
VSTDFCSALRRLVMLICCLLSGVCRPLETLRELRRARVGPLPSYVMVRSDVLAEHMHLGKATESKFKLDLKDQSFKHIYIHTYILWGPDLKSHGVKYSGGSLYT